MPPNWNEEKTRKEFIDKLISNSKWGKLVNFEEGASYVNQSVEEHSTDNGPVDYALFYKAQPLALVEGKKLAVGPQNVLQQACRYSKGFSSSPFRFQEFRVPFVYSTNGQVIWFHDLRHPLNLSRQVAQFHTPHALEELLSRDEDKARNWLQQAPVDHSSLRPYQIEAIIATEKAIAERKRQMLIAMATGTGKTFTIINLIYRLLKSCLVRRVLFLVDRKALAAQAVTALGAFEAEPGLKFDKIYETYSQRFRREDFDDDTQFDSKVLPESYLVSPDLSKTFVYVSTIQRMQINLFGRDGMFGIKGDAENDEDAKKLDIPIHSFDLVIADECHRGYTAQENSKWRDVLTHFDAIKVGLTATPAAHTTTFFREVVFRYDYERAVRENFLVDYDAIKINSEITVNGVFLKRGEEVGLKDTESGQMTFDSLEDARQLEAESNETDWSAPDRNRKIVRDLKKYILEQEKEFGHFPKTLIFADNDLSHTSHSDQLVTMLREEFSRGEEFVQKITGSPSVDRPLEKIRRFRNRPNPGIVVTVDMLSTGVDIPKLENIVFMRQVKSRILFEQMLGRGTRLCKDIGKDHFTVFDCFGGSLLEYFRKTTGITAEAPIKPSRTVQEIVDDIANNKDRKYNVTCLTKRLQRISKNITQESRLQFNYILGGVDISEFATQLKRRLDKNWPETIRILQSNGFLEICENYERPPRQFIITDKEDFVESEVLFRASDGTELKPADYISQFEHFVRNNPEKIAALDILLNRPKDFSVKELQELKKVLSTRPDQLHDKFTERNLRRAYHKELADIISLILHAAKGGELLTSESRINRGREKVLREKELTTEQKRWLDTICVHLKDNLLLQREDFDEFPIFTRGGIGYVRLNKIFNGELDQIIQEINEGILS